MSLSTSQPSHGEVQRSLPALSHLPPTPRAAQGSSGPPTYCQLCLPFFGLGLPPSSSPAMPLTGLVMHLPLPIPNADPIYLNNNNNNNSNCPPLTVFPADSIFGDPLPQPKAPGHIRLGFCNIAGFPASPTQNPRVLELWSFISQLDLDIFAGCESNLNWSKMPKSASLWEWFQSELPLRTIACHNIHDNFHQKQFGGTFLLGSGPITTNIMASGVDPSGLGRWSWFRLQGHTGRSVCIVCGYHPNKAKKASLQSVYSQQCHHLESLGDPTCPRAAFF